VRTFVEISRANLVANFHAIRRAAGENVEILAVVKADAYGHGACEVARTLEAAGARWFAVTSVSEGIDLRRCGIQGRIVVLAEDSEWNGAAEYNLTLMVHSLDQLRALAAWARAREISPQFHLEFDSGMGRLGLSLAQLDTVADLLTTSPHLRVEGVATHFAAAEDLASPQTEEQIRSFGFFLQRLGEKGVRPRYVHMANSAALAYRPQTRCSMVRPGLALYGYVMPPRGAAVEPPFRPVPVLTWKARVLAVKEFGPGVPLGYDASFWTESRMTIGVAAVGYGDGLDRRLSNGGPILAGGCRTRIVGLVSMDLCLVDLTPCRDVRPGDYVTLLGQEGQQTIDALETASYCGTVPYEILCRIGSRVARVYF
jgi:alanine racemase